MPPDGSGTRPPFRQRLVVLTDLVALRQVGIEVVLAGEHGPRSDLASQRQREPDGKVDGVLVGHRQSTRITETDRAHELVGLGAEPVLAAAEHLRPGAELDMDFQPDDRFPGGIEGCGRKPRIRRALRYAHVRHDGRGILQQLPDVKPPSVAASRRRRRRGFHPTDGACCPGSPSIVHCRGAVRAAFLGALPGAGDGERGAGGSYAEGLGPEDAFRLLAREVKVAERASPAWLKQRHSAEALRVEEPGFSGEGRRAGRFSPRRRGDRLRRRLRAGAHRAGESVAAVHAGWRGLAGGVLASAMRAMKRAGGADPRRPRPG